MSWAWRSALIVVVLGLASCGGGDEEAATTGTTDTKKAASSGPRVVNAHVSGRILAGHCAGKAGDGPAVMLESGTSGDQNQLAPIEKELAKETVVCAYDRAGVGGSDDPPKPPRPAGAVVSDLDSFLTATKVDPPYLLVGHSAGATFVFMYAQAHPDKVAGFVSMNPVPPYKTWLREARKVETKQEVNTLELPFYRGETEEPVDFTDTERMLTGAIPPAMPYAVMFDEDCDGDAEFCRRILPPAIRVSKSLAEVGEGGRYVRAEGAGHDIYLNDLPLVLKTIEEVKAEG